MNDLPKIHYTKKLQRSSCTINYVSNENTVVIDIVYW